MIYSETLKEWTTHLGIDVKAEKATIVKSSADGKVKDIKNDPRYGLTIIIEHSNGFETRYANLLTTEFVAEGEEDKAGQTIGTVGESSVYEIVDEPHLHFELLKNSELNNNTFKLFPVSDKPLIWKKDFSEKGNAFNEDIIGAFSSIIIHKSLYNNDLGTDVNSQVYCNKLLSIINFSIQALETMLNSLIPSKEYYNGYVHNLDQKLPDTIYTINKNNKNFVNTYTQINKDNNGIIVPKINAKKEISILINILKELYTVYAPRAKECEFLGGNILTPDHYIVELIKIINENSNSFKLHFMNNVEKYQWVIPTLKKLDYDIKYSDPFEKYFKNINNMDKLIEKKDHMHIMKILAKLILYKFLSIDDINEFHEGKLINKTLMGGRLVNHTTELNDQKNKNYQIFEKICEKPLTNGKRMDIINTVSIEIFVGKWVSVLFKLKKTAF